MENLELELLKLVQNVDGFHVQHKIGEAGDCSNYYHSEILTDRRSRLTEGI